MMWLLPLITAAIIAAGTLLGTRVDRIDPILKTDLKGKIIYVEGESVKTEWKILKKDY